MIIINTTLTNAYHSQTLYKLKNEQYLKYFESCESVIRDRVVYIPKWMINELFNRFDTASDKRLFTLIEEKYNIKLKELTEEMIVL